MFHVKHCRIEKLFLVLVSRISCEMMPRLRAKLFHVKQQANEKFVSSVSRETMGATSIRFLRMCTNKCRWFFDVSRETFTQILSLLTRNTW